MVSCDRSLDRGFLEKIIHCRRTADRVVRGVDVEHKIQNDDHQDKAVAVVTQERSAKAAQNDICTDACWDEKDSSIHVHASQCCDDSTSTK